MTGRRATRASELKPSEIILHMEHGRMATTTGIDDLVNTRRRLGFQRHKFVGSII